ncbi:hypothetical protein [Mesorhizobium sp.]|nr:hypothetical protein [Mesorhizobium sp.]
MTLKSKLSLKTFAEGEGASPELQALIGAHETAYVALHSLNTWESVTSSP